MILASVLTTNLAILVLAGFVGFIVISRIPNTLHTPLMSGTNAIHGVVLLGAMVLLGLEGLDALSEALLVIAVAFGTINVVGGFLVTDRMLDMFKSKPKPVTETPASGQAQNAAKEGSASHVTETETPASEQAQNAAKEGSASQEAASQEAASQEAASNEAASQQSPPEADHDGSAG